MKRMTMVLVIALGLGLGSTSPSADFDGDGTGDIAVFRPGSGLWGVRGVTRLYFGGSGDVPVPGDFGGEGKDQPAVFRSSNGLWAAQGVTRTYFGGSNDLPVPGDYNGDGTFEVGIFRGSSGLWAAKGVTRAYFGGSADTPIAPGRVRAFTGNCGLLQTGQTFSDLPGDDGDYQMGAGFNYQTLDPAGNGQVVTVDHITGLMWASDGLGQGCNWMGQTSWSEAVAWAEGLVFAGFSDWRLPNIRELHSIVDFGRTVNAINSDYFPNTQPGNYWSSTTREHISRDSAWVIWFELGTMGYDSKPSTSVFVRAVRDGE